MNFLPSAVQLPVIVYRMDERLNRAIWNQTYNSIYLYLYSVYDKCKYECLTADRTSISYSCIDRISPFIIFWQNGRQPWLFVLWKSICQAIYHFHPIQSLFIKKQKITPTESIWIRIIRQRHIIIIVIPIESLWGARERQQRAIDLRPCSSLGRIAASKSKISTNNSNRTQLNGNTRLFGMPFSPVWFSPQRDHVQVHNTTWGQYQYTSNETNVTLTFYNGI